MKPPLADWRPILMVLFGLAVGLPFAAPGSLLASDYGTLKKSADQLYYTGKYEEAKAAYLEAKALNDQDPELYLRLGDIALKQSQITEGVTWYEQAKRYNPQNPECRLSLGGAYFTQGRLDEALVEFKEAARLQPANFIALEYLGSAYYRIGQRQEALRLLTTLAQLTPNSYAIRLQLGQLLSEMGNYEQARGEFEKTIELAPSSPDGYVSLAGIETREGNSKKALELYEHALALAPRSIYLYITLGYLYLQEGSAAKAAELFTKALEIDPENRQLVEYKKIVEQLLTKTKEPQAPVTCYPDLPKPDLKLIGVKERPPEADGHIFVDYNLDVTNWTAFPAELFSAAPDLPPCGKNPTSARTWASIRNPQGTHIYGSCGAIPPVNYQGIRHWFAVEKGAAPPDSVFLVLEDRRCNIQYVSNSVRIAPQTTVTAH